jgi:predicted amidohydrolase YtcJ
VRTIYRNGRVHIHAAGAATAFVVQDGVLTWIGRDDGIGSDSGVPVVDLNGAFVTPAFVDAHVHLTATGLTLTGLDLSGAASLREGLDLVERAARRGRGRPLIGAGWDDLRWPERRPPTAAELDRAAYGGSVYLSRVDAHSAVISSALAASVPGLADLAGYRPDGWLTRAAHDAARATAFAALSAGQVRDAQRAALQRAAALGIGCVHEMAGPAISSADDLLSALDLAAAEPLPEVVGYWGELFGIDTARELGARGAAGDLFCDGSLGSHTAALREPYADRPDSTGTLRFGTGDLAEHIRQCDAAGLQAGFHAIGDAAVDQVLDAFDAASAQLGRAVGAGHRIEHAEYVRDPHRLAASGLVASMQPLFDATWGGTDGMYAERLGPHRALALNRFAELAIAGVPLAFGSDAPVTELGPWAAVRAAAYPRTPGAAISPASAFTAHTSAGWQASGEVGGGQLVGGAPATFAVWDTGNLDVVPGEPLPVCLTTVVRGRELYQLDT